MPADPTQRLRTSFREIILRDVFRDSLNSINWTHQGQPWLTAKQISDLREELLSLSANRLIEANEAVLKQLYRAQVDSNEVTPEQYPNVRLTCSSQTVLSRAIEALSVVSGSVWLPDKVPAEFG